MPARCIGGSRRSAPAVITSRSSGPGSRRGASAERVLGLPLFCYPQLRFGVASPVRLRTILERFGPDVVHVATEGPLGWAALMAAGSLGLPVASSFHTNYDHYLNHYGLGGLEYLLFAYLRWFHNRTAVTLVPSEATRRRLLADGMQRVEIWSRGVDGQAFHPRHRDPALRESLGLGPDDPLLLYVGRLAPEKNLPALLAAFARLRQRLPSPLADRVRLAVVGDGPLLDAFRAGQPPAVLFPAPSTAPPFRAGTPAPTCSPSRRGVRRSATWCWRRRRPACRSSVTTARA